MRIIRTDEVNPSDIKTQDERDWIYNGLDVCVTLEVHNVIHPQLDNATSATYSFSKDLCGPVLEMNLRGVLVDQRYRQEAIDEYHETLEVLQRNLERIVLDGVGLSKFNWASPTDLQTLFYTRLRIPPIQSKGRATVNREALEKLDSYIIARPIVRHLITMRDIAKKLSFLKTGIDPDGRMRTSYNIAGTSTGRFSSSYSEFGTGTNLQNIEEVLRKIFVADKGMKFAKFDAKAGESYCVGAIEWNLFKDSRYLDACETGDPHTATARVCWPKLGWTGRLEEDKQLAERPYYRHYTYRFMCKKLGHGSNYDGKAQTLATQSHLPITVVADFQPKYFIAFPAHKQWHFWVEQQVKQSGNLTTLTGRKRWFLGRRTEASTLREAIAYDPQGSLADIVNGAMLRIWREQTATLMMQDHDALTFQYPEELEDEVVPKLWAQLPQSIELSHGRTLTIPYDCKVGWNRADYDAKTNPDGLADYIPSDKRRRTPPMSILDRPVRRAYGKPARA